MKKISIITMSVIFLLCFINASWAGDAFPTKRIDCYIPTTAGSDGDIMARKVLEGVSNNLGQPIVIINKPGAAGSIAYRTVYATKPDGYSISLAFPTLFMCKMRGIMPQNHHDFTLIAQHGAFIPIVVASTKSKNNFESIQEVVNYGKSNPEKINFALSIKGGSWWAAAMIFQDASGVKFKNIPQEGSGAVVVTQLAGGHADIGVAGLASALSQLAAGNLRILATFGRERIQGKYNNVPTLIESGYDVTWDSPNFFIGPPGIPKQIVIKLTKAFEEEATKPEFVKFVQSLNATPVYRNPDELLKYLDKQEVVARKIMLNAGLLKK